MLLLSVVLPRWVDVVSTNFASLLFMPWFMLYLHISHVLCLQLPSICTQFNRPPDTSVHIYLPLASWTPSFSRFLQRQVNRKHSFNMIAMMLYSPCLKRTVCVGQPKPGQAEHPPLWLKPAARPSRRTKRNYVIQRAILTWYNTHISILNFKQFRALSKAEGVLCSLQTTFLPQYDSSVRSASRSASVFWAWFSWHNRKARNSLVFKRFGFLRLFTP